MNKKLDSVYKPIHPLTIVRDRYGGAYSGGEWLAFNAHPWEIEDGPPFADDATCTHFWDTDPLIGVGDSPEEAADNLEEKLEKDMYDESYEDVNRVEVIDDNGRSYSNLQASNVRVSFQDGDQTIKIFID